MSELVRLTWDVEAGIVRLDTCRRARGRGAWVHPDRHCCDLVIRRRAVGRALRVEDVDGRQVADLLEGLLASGEGHRDAGTSAPMPGDHD